MQIFILLSIIPRSRLEANFFKPFLSCFSDRSDNRYDFTNHEDLEMINPSNVRLFQMKMFQIKGWRKDFLRRIPFRGKRKLTISCNSRERNELSGN